MEKNSHSVDIRIAGILFSISWDRKMNPIGLGENMKRFLSQGTPDVCIHMVPGKPPKKYFNRKNRIFDSETVWSLYQVGEKMVLTLQAPAAGPDPYQMVVFDRDFRKGNVYHCLPVSKDSGDMLLSSLLGFPLFEVIMVCVLSRGFGFMVHACGIDDQGKGILFAGNSTHGKSTMARLWEHRATILNDDRIILRLINGQFWMFGTPFHGDYKDTSPHGAPIDKNFFLRHAQSNHIIQINGASAVSMIMTRCFPPLWDAEGMDFTLDMCAKLTDQITCFELGFIPDRNIVGFVRAID